MLIHCYKVLLACKQIMKLSQYFLVCLCTCLHVVPPPSPPNIPPPGQKGEKGEPGRDGKSLMYVASFPQHRITIE